MNETDMIVPRTKNYSAIKVRVWWYLHCWNWNGPASAYNTRVDMHTCDMGVQHILYRYSSSHLVLLFSSSISIPSATVCRTTVWYAYTIYCMFVRYASNSTSTVDPTVMTCENPRLKWEPSTRRWSLLPATSIPFSTSTSTVPGTPLQVPFNKPCRRIQYYR